MFICLQNIKKVNRKKEKTFLLPSGWSVIDSKKASGRHDSPTHLIYVYA